MSNLKGTPTALLSAFFIGLTPIFGKQAIRAGLAGLHVVAFRTLFAFLLLFIVILIFRRQFLYIYPVGLAGCLLAGSLNGLGSLFFYSALERIDAGLGQLLYAMYPVFVAGLLYLDGQRHSKLTLVRITLSLPAIYLLTQAKTQIPDLTGVGFMLLASLLYALHIPINERVLYEVPPPTVTLYTLAAMAAVVLPVNFILAPVPNSIPNQAWVPLLGLTLVTFFSRLTLFTGIRYIGGMQTALIGLLQLVITIVLAQLWLGETLSMLQWIGAIVLVFAILLVDREKPIPRPSLVRGWLYWLQAPLPPPSEKRINSERAELREEPISVSTESSSATDAKKESPSG